MLTGVAPSDGAPNEVDLDTLRLADSLPVLCRPDIGAAEAQLYEAGAAVGCKPKDGPRECS